MSSGAVMVEPKHHPMLSLQLLQLKMIPSLLLPRPLLSEEDEAPSGETTTEAIEAAADPTVAEIVEDEDPIIIIQIVIRMILLHHLTLNLTRRAPGTRQTFQMTRAAAIGRMGRLRPIVVIPSTAAGRTSLLQGKPEK